MKKLFLVALVAICAAACNSNADSSTTGDSTSAASGDSLSAGSSSSTGGSSMQGTGSDTGYHGATMDSSRMGTMDTSGKK